jgi:1-acyl-sn-glycerol-3-phosphate acyltransferase
MRSPPVLVRRLVIDPLWIPVAAAGVLLFLLAAWVAAAMAPMSLRRRLPRLAVFGALYLAVDAGLLICCAGLWVRHPLPARRDELCWSHAHEALLRKALSLLVAAARPLLGFTIELEEPPDAHRITGKPLLVLARHGGPGDSFALVELLMSRYRRRPAIVLKDTLRWDPGLDVLLSRLPSCFVGRGEGRTRPGRSAQARIAELARNMRADDAILLFPEGGNWTPHRHRAAIARLRRAGRRKAAAEAAGNPNVLPPQPAGLLACLRERPDLDVAVVAHTGLDELVSPALMWRALPVSDQPMTVRWWREEASNLPASDNGRCEWLRIQWAIVDAWIDARKAAQAHVVAGQLVLPAAQQRTLAGGLPAAEPLADPSPDG